MNTQVAPPKKESTLAPKVPPYSIEAEQSVLGALMLDNRAWDRVIEHVAVSDFYRNEHQLIFTTIQTLVDRNQPCDSLTLAEELKQLNKLEQVGGESYLFELANATPSSANVASYATIVRERSVLRKMIAVGSDLVDNALNTQGRSPKDLLDQAEREVYRIAEQQLRGAGPVKIADLLSAATQKIDDLFQSGERITGASTGFYDFDDMTSGLQSGDLVIVAGRPSMGKTTFAMNVAENVAVNGQSVLVFSLEMPGEHLTMRMLSSLGRINQHNVRTGNLTDDDWPRISSAVSMLADVPLYIDDTPALSPSELRARARRVARENNGLDLIVIDYLQLMQVPELKENRTNEVAEISRSLKALAKELECPVIAASQLNRGLESRTDKRPVMSDLRESGSIEQDADLIAFIYRDEVYNPDSPDKGVAEILIRKQRNGPIGEVRLAFLGEFTRFDNLTQNFQSGA
ncbi:MAG: replicative DNA helicase [Legionellales bacterium]|nr:replicative DNA helicase [Legionellales bacterium]HAG61277.1 replicative DNA helicase [Coxiellaceae bacterium]